MLVGDLAQHTVSKPHTILCLSVAFIDLQLINCVIIIFNKVKMIRNVNKKDHKIDEILQEVEELVDYAMDVVDKAERCKDPEIPY